MTIAAPLARVDRDDVMGRATVDDLPHIQQVWPAFERLVGLGGRKMYAMVDVGAGTYTACMPVRADDDPDQYGLQPGTLPGGAYRRGRLVGEPPQVYELIGPGLKELESAVEVDPGRPLVEFYRRHDEIELWVPIKT